MKHLALAIVSIVVLLGLMVVSGAFYIVTETEQVVITQFGEPVGDAVTTPGLKLKVPFIQKVNPFEKRFLEWDGNPNQIPTKDKRFIWVDTTARWRITDPLLFFQRLHDERQAQSRLDDILDGETRNAIANHDLIEVVRTSNRTPTAAEELSTDEQVDFPTIKFGRERVRKEILAAASARTTDLGIEILDFRLKRINYVEDVQREVYSRMISERKRIAERYRSEGAGEAARIAGEKERELKRIQSEAYKTAEEIRGKADAEAADIYASAYDHDRDFYRFSRSLDTLVAGIDAKTVLVLSTDGELLRQLEKAE